MAFDNQYHRPTWNTTNLVSRSSQLRSSSLSPLVEELESGMPLVWHSTHHRSACLLPEPLLLLVEPTNVSTNIHVKHTYRINILTKTRTLKELTFFSLSAVAFARASGSSTCSSLALYRRGWSADDGLSGRFEDALSNFGFGEGLLGGWGAGIIPCAWRRSGKIVRN